VSGIEDHAPREDLANRGTQSVNELRGEWDAIAEGLDHPFLASSWLSLWWEAFAPMGAQPAVVKATDAFGLVQAAPLYRPLHGQRLHGFANVHTPISGIVSSERATRAMIDLPPGVRRLVWQSLNHAEAVAMAAELSTRGWLGLVEPQHRSPVVEMEQSADAYAGSRGRSLRQRAGRLERKLRREHDASFVFAHPYESRGFFEECLQLEAFGWKGRGKTAILSDLRTARFYRAVAATSGARVAAIASPTGPIAFAFCLLHRDRLFLLKTGYDERFRNLSPGFALQYWMIALCHELDLQAYELLGAADPWKLQLANADRPISRLIADRRTLVGRTRQLVRKARPAAKSVRARVVH
jgi:CelD/BcsL family acetyltransferase involved in cellulose biosynthesis